MKYEKSCGAIVYHRNSQNKIELLLICHRHGGHWSFPKGHVEGKETEKQTALREVREETGKIIKLKDGFREQVEYSPKQNVQKHVVYFLAETDNCDVIIQEEEISQFCWMELKRAFSSVIFDNDRKLIKKTSEFLNERL